MASSSGNSSGSSNNSAEVIIQNPGSHLQDLPLLVDQRKRKRMQSNRESAKRSRMKKQKHVDDLKSQVCQLKGDNNQIRTSINISTQELMSIESENSILRAQLVELKQRLDSLNEILHFINTTNNGVLETAATASGHHHRHHPAHGDFMMNTNMYHNQPIMASPDVFQYY